MAWPLDQSFHQGSIIHSDSLDGDLAVLQTVVFFFL